MAADLIRSKLIVPAHRMDFIEKSVRIGADRVVFDLEDGVPEGEKEAARRNIRAALALCRQNGVSAGVRVNPLGSGRFVDDFLSAACEDLTEVHLPKVNGPRDIWTAEALLVDVERKLGLNQRIAIVPTLESPAAVRCADEIAGASPRVSMLQFGAADYVAAFEMGVGRERNLRSDAQGEMDRPVGLSPLDYARLRIVHAAAEFGIPAVDSAYLRYRDADGFRREAEIARLFGFQGKSCIHPSQVDVANQVFSPTLPEIDEAFRVLERAAAEGAATFSHQDAFVDAPVIRRALRVVERASHLGLVDEARFNQIKGVE